MSTTNSTDLVTITRYGVQRDRQRQIYFQRISIALKDTSQAIAEPCYLAVVGLNQALLNAGSGAAAEVPQPYLSIPGGISSSGATVTPEFQNIPNNYSTQLWREDALSAETTLVDPPVDPQVI